MSYVQSDSERPNLRPILNNEDYCSIRYNEENK